MNLFLDMDGVLCDFIGAAYKLHGRVFDPSTYPKGEWYCEKQMGISNEQFWQAIHEEGETFWANLEPYPWARELVADLHRHGQIVIATSPSISPYSYSGKRKWLRRMGWDKIPSMFGSEKHLMAKPGRILIDDGMHNIAAWRNEGGQAIVIPQPWNTAQPVGNVSSFVLEEVRALLSPPVPRGY